MFVSAVRTTMFLFVYENCFFRHNMDTQKQCTVASSFFALTSMRCWEMCHNVPFNLCVMFHLLYGHMHNCAISCTCSQTHRVDNANFSAWSHSNCAHGRIHCCRAMWYTALTEQHHHMKIRFPRQSTILFNVKF